jgi:hypothetical protein
LVEICTAQEVSELDPRDRMSVTVHIEVQSSGVVFGDELSRFRDPVLEFVPSVFGEWITLSGFDDLTIWVEFTTM